MTSLDDFVPPNDPTPKGWEAGIELGTEEGTITSGPVTSPITNWDDILLIWNLDPEHFEVLEPATFKAWDGYAKEENPDGTSSLVSKRLFSYRARIRRRNPEAVRPELIAKWHAKLLNLHTREPKQGEGKPVTYAMFVADPQLGKKRTAEAVENWKRGIRNHVQRIETLRAAGHNINHILLGFQGDEHEQVANNYANQPYTIELNMSEQLELDFSMRVWSIEQVAALSLPVLVTSVYSNHGEWTRNDSKDPVTSKADNSSTCVTRLVRELVERVPALSRVTFEIADGNPDIVLETSGVRLALSHGHVAKGKGSTSEQRTKNAIERQILGRTKELADVQLYVVAHYHHHYLIDFEGRTLIGCPALEAERSSEYMLEKYGVWSRPGMLGFLIGDKWPSGWSEMAVL